MAIPANVLAEDPPATASVESLKLPVKRLVTVAPEGFVLSSLIATRVADPVATGASLTAVTLWLSTTVAAEYWVVPPMVVMFVPVAKFTAPELLSISKAVIVGAGPLKFATGRNRRLWPVGTIVAAD